MNLLVWILFGGLTGWVASVIMRTNTSQGMLGDILLGVVGALVGGFIMNLFGQTGVTGFNLYSFIVALLGALLLVWARRRFA